ncbi:MAG: hypothetical protein ONB12_12730 [candidate division KSB1 bacterium]|nr:hypothetical protein [candidate division KSB1 bacterium]
MNLILWSPFQLKEVKEICVNMTPKEKFMAARRAFLYGLWIVVSLLIPLFGVVKRPEMGSFILAAIGFLLHILYLPVLQRKQKEFLCGTESARENGITPDKLALFKK